MDGNKWQELNSSTSRIGQSSQTPPVRPSTDETSPTPAPEPSQARQPEPENDKEGAGMPVAAKAGIAIGALALLGLGGIVAIGSGGSEEPAAPASTVVSEDDQLAEAVDLADGDAAAPDSLADADDPDAADGAADPDAADPDAADPDVADSGAPVDGGDPEEADPNQPDTSPQGSLTDLPEYLDDPVLMAALGPDSPIPPPGAPAVHSILAADGKLYLRGYVPSEQIEALVIAAIVPVMGEGNVVSEYVIDPTKPFNPGEGSPTYIADTVLFAPGSSAIDPAFHPLFVPGLTLMQLQPGVNIEVVGHTDSQGDDAANLQLSQDRTDAVRDYFISQGADPERVISTGKGETEPRADNSTAEGRQLNRRVEFIITGFEFG